MAATIGYDVLTLHTVLFDMLLDDEEDQIRGVVHIADAKGVRMPHFTVFTPQHSFRIGKNTEVIKSKDVSIRLISYANLITENFGDASQSLPHRKRAQVDGHR